MLLVFLEADDVLICEGAGGCIYVAIIVPLFRLGSFNFCKSPCLFFGYFRICRFI